MTESERAEMGLIVYRLGCRFGYVDNARCRNPLVSPLPVGPEVGAVECEIPSRFVDVFRAGYAKGHSEYLYRCHELNAIREADLFDAENEFAAASDSFYLLAFDLL